MKMNISNVELLPIAPEDIGKYIGDWVWLEPKNPMKPWIRGWAFVATPNCLGYLDKVLAVKGSCGVDYDAYPQRVGNDNPYTQYVKEEIQA